MPSGCRNERKITSMIAPHAGYKASGMNAAYAYKELSEDGLPDIYVVIGPDHHGIPYDMAVCGEPYVTPLGTCKVNEEIIKELRKAMPDDVRSHRYEHSVEVQIPFIQYIDPDPCVIPIIMSDQSQESAEYLSEAIEEACDGHDHVVIASSDLSHYVSKDQARSEAADVIKNVCARNVKGLYDIISERRITTCGYGPMAVAMLTESSSSELLKYSDSSDPLGMSNEVVGYVSVAFRR